MNLYSFRTEVPSPDQHGQGSIQRSTPSSGLRDVGSHASIGQNVTIASENGGLEYQARQLNASVGCSFNQLMRQLAIYLLASSGTALSTVDSVAVAVEVGEVNNFFNDTTA